MWTFWAFIAGIFAVVGGMGALGVLMLVPLALMEQRGDYTRASTWQRAGICAVLAVVGFVGMALILDVIGNRVQ